MPKGSKRPKSSPILKKQDAFLAAFSNVGTISKACAAVGITRAIFYHWRDTDPAFKAAFEDVDLALTEKLEERAVQLAMRGETSVLTFLLRARLPAKYREKHEVSFDGPMPLTITYSNDRGGDGAAPSLSIPSTPSKP